MESKQQLQQDNGQMNYNMKVAVIGFFGGLFWSIIGYIAFFFNFIKVGPALVLMPWALGDWKNGYIGQLVGIAVIAVISILVAFVYRFILQKVFRIWAGAVYGVILWVIVFYLLNPIFPGLKPVADLDLNTIVTSLCIYILYGVFIGYSISYEYQEINKETESTPKK